MAKEQIDNSLISLINSFNQRYKELKSRLPYHINVIDELHINENAHSRILCKLLLYQSKDGKYEMLESLIAYIADKHCGFKKIQIKTPIITQERDRIDLRVQDKEYAIIIENKVYDANDQVAQLARYIQKTRDCGFMDENIYVVYMSSINEHRPTEQTWIDEKGNSLKEMFSERYAHISFKEDILDWLKKIVLPKIHVDERFLYAAIIQYIDYLDGFFNKREINRDMNQELNNYLEQKLGISHSDDEEKYKILNDTKKEIDILYGYIDSAIYEINKKVIIEKWKGAISTFKTIIKNVASECDLKRELKGEFQSGEDTGFWIRFYKDKWELSIIIGKYGYRNKDCTHRLFIYIGKPNEEAVDCRYTEQGVCVFGRDTFLNICPYGWEEIQEYNYKFDLLIEDIENGKIKDKLASKINDVLNQIKEKNIRMA